MEKKQKILLILLAIAIVIAVIAWIISLKHGDHGNLLDMTCLDTVQSQPGTKDLSVYVEIENSYSMKGYVVKERGVVYNEMTFEGIMGDIVSKSNHIYGNDNTEWVCGNKKGKSLKDLYDNGIQNGEIFNSGDTQIHEYIEKVGLLANDTTVSMFVSDMIFSLSRNQMGGNSTAIIASLPKLQSKVKDALMTLKNNNLYLLMVQYLSDFNGTYYYDCTNKPIFKNMIMHKRPYYVLVFGTKDNINKILADNILPQSEKIWVTFALDTSDYTKKSVMTTPDKHWKNYDPDSVAGHPFTFWNEYRTDWEDQPSTVTLSFYPLPGRVFLQPDWTPVWDSSEKSVITGVQKKSEKEIEISFKPYNQLADTENITVSLVCERLDWKGCSTDNDILPKDSMSLLEGKTWAFEKLIEAIKEVYPSVTKEEEVGKIEFQLMKL